jgi:hypothetical protein
MNKILAVWISLLSFNIAAEGVDNLKTINSNQVALTLSSYAYKEPSLGVKMEATNAGIEYFGTYKHTENLFSLYSVDYNNAGITSSKVKYTGSGTKSSVPQDYINLKAAIGHDFIYDDFILSPYVGFGYRYLDQDLTGTTSTGAVGYTRKSTYQYIPIGIIHKKNLDSNAKLETTLEYDYLIVGNQRSGFDGFNGGSYSGFSAVNNKQKTGYGINLTVLYKKDNWGVGPYFKYWDISKSETVTSSYYSGSTKYNYTAYEPKNQTNEYGVKFTYSF